MISILLSRSWLYHMIKEPLLLALSYFTGNPVNLVFANPLDLIAVAGGAFAVNAIVEDDIVTWFEGVLLVAVYAILAMAFLFVTP